MITITFPDGANLLWIAPSGTLRHEAGFKANTGSKVPRDGLRCVSWRSLACLPTRRMFFAPISRIIGPNCAHG